MKGPGRKELRKSEEGNQLSRTAELVSSQQLAKPNDISRRDRPGARKTNRASRRTDAVKVAEPARASRLFALFARVRADRNLRYISCEIKRQTPAWQLLDCFRSGWSIFDRWCEQLLWVALRKNDGRMYAIAEIRRSTLIAVS